MYPNTCCMELGQTPAAGKLPTGDLASRRHVRQDSGAVFDEALERAALFEYRGPVAWKTKVKRLDTCTSEERDGLGAAEHIGGLTLDTVDAMGELPAVLEEHPHDEDAARDRASTQYLYSGNEFIDDAHGNPCSTRDNQPVLDFRSKPPPRRTAPRDMRPALMSTSCS